MKRTVHSFWLLTGVMALPLCWASGAFATDFEVTGWTGQLWGEYTSPYTTNSATVGNIICDDFKDVTYIGQNDTYNQVSVNSIIAANGVGGVWSGVGGSGAQYAAAAYLALQIYGSSGLTQQYYNWALWAFFDPSDALKAMNSNGVNSAGCTAIFGSMAWAGGSCVGGTGGVIGDANKNGWADYLAGDFNNLVLYTPQNGSGTGWCSTPGSCKSQEFFGSVPEGGSALMYLLLAGVTCVGAVFYSWHQSTMGGLV